MANDYYKYNMLSDFEMRVQAANPEYATGRTGYENYYIDLQGFWRQLYNPEIGEKLEKATREQLNLEATQETQKNKIKNIEGYLIEINSALQKNPSNISEADKWFNEFYEKFKDLYKKTFEDVIDIYVKVYYMRIILQNERDELENIKAELEKINEKVENYTTEKENYYQAGKHKYWNKDIYEAPDKLNFWFDFLDSSDSGREMSKYDVKNIGARPKAINDSNVKSIYFRETPNVIYVKQGDEFGGLNGYRYINCGNIDNMFTISAQGKSAKERLDELLYQHSYCVESVTISAIPIYYLEPNTRIYIHDDNTGIDGDYIVSKISLPLAYNGTMQITATKAAENIIT